MCCRLRRRSVNASLAHVERNGAWAAYLRWTYLEDRAKLMQWWADYLDGRKMGKLLKMKKNGPPDGHAWHISPRNPVATGRSREGSGGKRRKPSIHAGLRLLWYWGQSGGVVEAKWGQFYMRS
jgi:hypothetical protein